MNLSLLKINENAYQIRDGEKSSSMLSRYGILKGVGTPISNGEAVSAEKDSVHFLAKRAVDLKVTKYGERHTLSVSLSETESFFGLGDSSRDGIQLRGKEILLEKSNVKCYGPMPLLLSSDGWAILVNTTYKTVFDIGKNDKSTLVIKVYGGQIDFYLFKAESLLGLVRETTRITGRPMMLPKFGYGLTVVNNEDIAIPQLLEYIRLYREQDIPCDMMGLEPSWMQEHYDFTNDKWWNKDKFYVPYWMPKNTAGAGTFFHPVRCMGMQMSLWLCEDYDLIYHEEGILPPEKDESGFPEGTEIEDEHFRNATVYQDKLTKIGEPWFEHLKKFVDNCAAGFKLDASNQVFAHPDRCWGGKFHDDEVHNVYPVILAKQMFEGFKEHTGRRIMTNTACAYIGTQQYAATWAGDTGGGPKTLISIMNYAMCGHSNTSCDMATTDPYSIHYCFLSPWAQQNFWNSWNYPFYLDEELKKRFVFYDRLRSAIFPYIYYTAHQANKEGTPILRPLPLVYEGKGFENVNNAYMLGDNLFVGAFDMHFPLPEGEWVDYFTGEIYEGGKEIDYEPKGLTSGALFVKNGAVIVTMKPQKYILEKDHEYIVNLYPSEVPGESAIYEDDGFTFDYENGGYALTEIKSSGIQNGRLTLTVGKREGDFAGRPDNGHNLHKNSIPKIEGIRPLSDLKVVIHGKHATSVMLAGAKLPFAFDNKDTVFFISAEQRADAPLAIEIEF
jgi:alpha-glucosidase (family GH31 glycosyl hydrolase)